MALLLYWYFAPILNAYIVMTSSHGNIFRVTGHLCREFTGDRWISRTKASDAELWFFFDLRLNKRLSKQWWGWWFETPSRPLWRHCNGKFRPAPPPLPPSQMAIDLLHKSPPVPYSTMHHFITEMCAYVNISVTKWCIVGYLFDATTTTNIIIFSNELWWPETW